ncbi:unnamed protein product [Amoebophrya sp. A25]|nr:unnamed protein product [Amoebophrya sp. A25]|eukprot:GSA25T00006302001.1
MPSLLVSTNTATAFTTDGDVCSVASPPVEKKPPTVSTRRTSSAENNVVVIADKELEQENINISTPSLQQPTETSSMNEEVAPNKTSEDDTGCKKSSLYSIVRDKNYNQPSALGNAGAASAAEVARNDRLLNKSSDKNKLDSSLGVGASFLEQKHRLRRVSDMFAFDLHPAWQAEANEPVESEEQRLHRWRTEDPILIQEAFATSNAFLQACKDGDLEEACAIIRNAENYTEFLQYHVIQAYYACVRALDWDLFLAVFVEQSFPVGLFAEVAHAVCEMCAKDTFDVCRKFLKKFFNVYEISVDHPRHRDGLTPLCVACLRGCLPLSVILLEEYNASCHVITRHNLTPFQLNEMPQPGDTEQIVEGRQLLKNRMCSMGVGRNAQEVLRKLRQHGGSILSGTVKFDNSTRCQQNSRATEMDAMGSDNQQSAEAASQGAPTSSGGATTSKKYTVWAGGCDLP